MDQKHIGHPQIPGACCASCPFWAKEPPDVGDRVGIGYCRAETPTIAATDVTHPDYWCGHHPAVAALGALMANGYAQEFQQQAKQSAIMVPRGWPPKDLPQQ